LIVAVEHAQAVTASGLDDPQRWADLLAAAEQGAPGRGATSRLELTRGRCVVLKQMRRGGLAGPLWRQRFPGTQRLMQNLSVPLEAARRGVATPAAIALLLVPGPPGLYRGWLAVEEIEGAEDLASRVIRGEPPRADEWAATAKLVRSMHDAGLEHRDLNLGNLLVRGGPETGLEVFVVDLDRARLHEGALPFRLRQSALRRLERSYLKLSGGIAAWDGSKAASWYGLYAAEDRELEDRLRRGRATGRFWVRLHRLGWRRQPPRN
jgi:3-deoxy-D-manno-octulosonic acid kinase